MALEILNLSKSFFSPEYDRAVTVLDRISFSVREGEFLSIFGPNGCGKTTLLKIAAGLERPDTGRVVRDWSNADIHASIGYAFQNYGDTLLPWEKVIDNVIFPLLSKNDEYEDRYGRAREVLRELGAEFDVGKYPYQLSGGEQQLCCLARALVHDPRVLFLDEPFSALDIEVRRRMQEFIVRLWRERRVTIVMISHDLDEALLLASRFILLSKKPGTIKLDLPVELPYPRTWQRIESQEFYAIRNRVLAAIREEAGA